MESELLVFFLQTPLLGPKLFAILAFWFLDLLQHFLNIIFNFFGLVSYLCWLAAYKAL